MCSATLPVRKKHPLNWSHATAQVGCAAGVKAWQFLTIPINLVLLLWRSDFRFLLSYGISVPVCNIRLLPLQKHTFCKGWTGCHPLLATHDDLTESPGCTPHNVCLQPGSAAQVSRTGWMLLWELALTVMCQVHCVLGE